MNKKLSSWLIANGFSKQSKSIVGGGDSVRFFSSSESLDSLVYIDKYKM